MFTDTHQTETPEVSHGMRAIRFGRMAGWLIVGLVVASLTVGLFWTQNSVQHPGAERKGATQFQLGFQPKGNTFDSTFTKWVTTSPPAAGVIANMVGVVGGDVGTGTYTGEVLSVNTVGNITSIHARYHFNGSKHAFTADLNVTQDESAGTATITGYVTEGWLQGASVTGEYNVLAVCPIETHDNAYGTLCFQGALHIHVPK